MMPVPGRSPILPENADPNSRRMPRNSSKNGKGRDSSRLEVLDRVGEGTLWIVYRVRERGVAGAPIVALKALKSAPNRHARLPEKLFTGTLGWQKFNHPALAVPIEVGTEEGTLFQTMEFLSGGSLETRLDKSAFAPEIALGIVGQIATGLDYLHSQDIFHGDVRPCQILFDVNGDPRITDGGIAEAFAQAGLALADVQGEVAYYLAPERTQGFPFSTQADIYSLGVMFYRMLTGRVPFDGASTLAISARHRNDAPVPPSQFRPKISPEIEQLVLRMLAKNPGERPTASQIVHQARKLLPGAGAYAVAPAIEEDSVISTPVSPSNQDDPPIIAKAPKRQPLDDLVTKNMDDDNKAKKQVSVEVARKRHKRREFWGFFGAFIWLLMLIGIGGGMAYGAYHYWVSETPKEVVVPKYVGLNSDDAKQVLAKKGLYMKVIRESFDPKVPAGTVLIGEPEGGRTVRSKREVTVTVSAGRSPIKMVDFTRLTLNQARQIIVKHGLRLGTVVQQYHDTIPDTFICGQFPDPGDPLRRSEPITLIVSRGPQPTEIGVNGDELNPDANVPEPTSDPGEVSGDDNFEPLPQVENGAGSASENQRAIISVQVPKGPAQNVRILVRDANGERTVYQRTRRGGTEVKQTVDITKIGGEQALVRVYIGEDMVREQNF